MLLYFMYSLCVYCTDSLRRVYTVLCELILIIKIILYSFNTFSSKEFHEELVNDKIE